MPLCRRPATPGLDLVFSGRAVAPHYTPLWISVRFARVVVCNETHRLAGMSIPDFTLAAQVGRVPSMRVPLDDEQELRFQRLMDDLVLIDVHQHPMVLSADAAELPAYFRANAYAWGFDAVKAGGWTAVATANLLSCLGKEPDASFSRFGDLVDEIGMMLTDVHKRSEQVMKLTRAPDLLDAQQWRKVGVLPALRQRLIGG